MAERGHGGIYHWFSEFQRYHSADVGMMLRDRRRDTHFLFPILVRDGVQSLATEHVMILILTLGLSWVSYFAAAAVGDIRFVTHLLTSTEPFSLS